MMMRLLSKFRFHQLTKQQVSFYEDNGYLIIPDAVTKEQISELQEQTDKLINSADILTNQIFFEPKPARGISFMETASTIGYLLEKGVVSEDGKQLLVSDKRTALNKIGHAMHDIDPVFERFSYTKVCKSVLKSIGYVDPMLTQSMMIFKNQKVGTPVDMHTDNMYIISEPTLSCVGVWIALDDAKKHNGCMYAFPKSHKIPTTYFSKLSKDKSHTTYVGTDPEYEKHYNVRDAACLEVPKGTMILLHGDLVHYSGHNTSTQPRNAYTMHFIESHNNRWSPDAWLQREIQCRS